MLKLGTVNYKDTGILLVGTKEWAVKTYGEEQVEYWLENVEMKNLWYCLGAVSNNALVHDYKLQHREHYMNCLEMVLQGKTGGLYRSVTYGVSPNAICTSEIGYLTGRTYGNFDIAMFLIEQKIDELKEWLLSNHKFTEREIRLLHYNLTIVEE